MNKIKNQNVYRLLTDYSGPLDVISRATLKFFGKSFSTLLPKFSNRESHAACISIYKAFKNGNISSKV